jgi:cell division initiation protein
VRITPMDIRQQQFTVKMFRGFAVQEVDTFLEDVAEDYEALLKENVLLKEQLQALEDRTRGLEGREKVLQDTLVTTQRLTEEMKEHARREAAIIRKEAELAAEKHLETLRADEAALRAGIQQLRRQRQQLAEALRSTLDMHHRLIEQDLAGEPAGGEAPSGA